MSLLKKYNIDIIHTHNEAAHFYGAFAGFLTKTPLLHTRHGVHDLHNKKRVLMDRFSSLLSRKVVGVSSDISNLCEKTIKVPGSKIVTILNGVPTDMYSPRRVDRETLLGADVDDGATIIGIVGRLARVKDHKTLFKACRILKQSNERFLLVVVGDGPLKDELMTCAADLGIGQDVAFTGARRDIADLMNSFDIFALSSASEGISMTLLEAMACELPVVATSVGGNPEVVVDGETGLLVPSGNPAALAEKLSLFMKDVGLRKRMGAAGRARVVKNFSIQKSAKEYEECYWQILGRTR